LLSHVRVSRQLPIALKGEFELCNGYLDMIAKSGFDGIDDLPHTLV
jgi:hypothetical protein